MTIWTKKSCLVKLSSLYFQPPEIQYRVKYLQEKLARAYQAGRYKNLPISESKLRDWVTEKVEIDVVSSGPQPLVSQRSSSCGAPSIVGFCELRQHASRRKGRHCEKLRRIKSEAEHPLSLQWFANFMGKYPDLKVRKPRGLVIRRARATSEDCVTGYFNELKKTCINTLLQTTQNVYTM